VSGAGVCPSANNRRRIVVTFDNLGEASEFERGKWDPQVPLGHHSSVTVVLPKLLESLDGLGMTLAFFVEAGMDRARRRARGLAGRMSAGIG
jgi:hypothetical protein